MRIRLATLAYGVLGAFILVWLAPVAEASPATIPHDFFAVVNADATLARGTAGTTVAHLGPGRYDVTFPGSVASCAANANLGHFGNIAGDGTRRAASPGVTAGPHVTGSGQYVLHFGQDISACAPVATVRNGRNRHAFAAQAFLALGSDGQSLQVSVNKGTTKPVDWGFDVVITCGQEPSAVFPASNGFYDSLSVPQAGLCALTGNWYNPTPGSAPSDQGYVSTWASSPTTARIQTKNGGYGIEPGFGVDLVATC